MKILGLSEKKSNEKSNESFMKKANRHSDCDTLSEQRTSDNSNSAIMHQTNIFQGLFDGAIQRKSSLSASSGLPDELKKGIETQSGYSMDDVKVHYNSHKPDEVGALAYTGGDDIFVAPGQEKHLPHEAWHVVQQKQGRVKPTVNTNGYDVNDNANLEHEADIMGERALRDIGEVEACDIEKTSSQSDVVQCYMIKESQHYQGDGHFGVKSFLFNQDFEQGISNQLYRKASKHPKTKHVAFFPVAVKNGDKEETIAQGQIVIVFRYFDDSDVLMYDTAYYTTHPSGTGRGEIVYNSTTALVCTRKDLESFFE